MKKSEKRLVYSINNSVDIEKIVNVGVALSRYDRVKILKELSVKPLTLSELSEKLGMAVSSISFHIDILQQADLVTVNYRPGLKGHGKLCIKPTNMVTVLLEDFKERKKLVEKTVEMPVGDYIDINCTAPCGFAGESELIGAYDDPKAMFSPSRTKAELLWFRSGYVSYAFPNDGITADKGYSSISFSMEICSEVESSAKDWPSDTTFWINDTEICTWTSPADYGGRRGKFTPDYWFINNTQYGVLKRITVSETGAYLDGTLIDENITFSSLNIAKGTHISLKIGIKSDAKHVGGLNVFGKRFGDYPQSIIMTLSNN